MADGGLVLPPGVDPSAARGITGYTAEIADREFREGRPLPETALGDVASTDDAIDRLDTYAHTTDDKYLRATRAGQFHGELYSKQAIHVLHPRRATTESEPFKFTDEWYGVVSGYLIKCVRDTSIDPSSGLLSEKQSKQLGEVIAVFLGTAHNAAQNTLATSSIRPEKPEMTPKKESKGHTAILAIGSLAYAVVSGVAGAKGVHVATTGLIGMAGGALLEGTAGLRDMTRNVKNLDLADKEAGIAKRNAARQKLLVVRDAMPPDLLDTADRVASILTAAVLTSGRSVRRAVIEVLRRDQESLQATIDKSAADEKDEAERKAAAEAAKGPIEKRIRKNWRKTIAERLGARAVAVILSASAGLGAGVVGNAVGSITTGGGDRPASDVPGLIEGGEPGEDETPEEWLARMCDHQGKPPGGLVPDSQDIMDGDGDTLETFPCPEPE